MIEVHHLSPSRSRRITWLCEELGVAYRPIVYTRTAANVAPPELKAIHPLGKSPVIRDDGEVIHESGAIIEYLIRKYGNGRFAPAVGSKDYNRYLQLLHYAEGSAVFWPALHVFVSRYGAVGEALQARIVSETNLHLGYLDGEIAGREFFVGDDLTGADINLAFVVQGGVRFAGQDAFPNLTRYVDRIEARPAYQRAIAKAGP